jgi:hypothetical protein
MNTVDVFSSDFKSVVLEFDGCGGYIDALFATKAMYEELMGYMVDPNIEFLYEEKEGNGVDDGEISKHEICYSDIAENKYYKVTIEVFNNSTSAEILVTKEVDDSLYKKWRYICLVSDTVASEILNTDEAKQQLSIAESRNLLKYFGDDEFIEITDDYEFVTLE